MKVFVELTHFAATAGRSALRDRVTALEDPGATRVDATAPIPAASR